MSKITALPDISCNKIIIDISDKELIECSLCNQDVNVNWHDLSLDEKANIVAALTSITNMFSKSFERDKLNQNANE